MNQLTDRQVQDEMLRELRTIRELLLAIANNTNRDGGHVSFTADDRPVFGEKGSWYR